MTGFANPAGLSELESLLPPVSVEQVFHLDPKAASRGFLYL